MKEAVFLSAGVPDAKREPEHAGTADSVAIAAAVSALVYVLLGRRPLVWGGHPAITPMIMVAAEDVGVEYSAWVRLYQSLYFKDEFPDDNRRFQNVLYTDNVNGDRKSSLRAMRERMFAESEFRAAVFIGGMSGIVEEFDLFRQMQPNATLVPVVSTGGATLVVARRLPNVPSDLKNDFDYVALFHRYLDISPREERYASPSQQPKRVEDRYWRST